MRRKSRNADAFYRESPVAERGERAAFTNTSPSCAANGSTGSQVACAGSLHPLPMLENVLFSKRPAPRDAGKLRW